jgi:tetratricopeptide (TPR) repeat protein
MNSIGRYQLTEKLGQGGMGVVYRAFDTLLQRVVAVKVISSTVQTGPEQRERFFREARAAGQLSHRNIITIHDLGEHEGQPYLAMEYLEGEDLQHRLARREPMSLAAKVALAIDLCAALEYAHARGVVHRDVKPANIFITESGSAKILDFGLARLMTSELTNSNMMMGTVNYMAPEQVRGERADHRSDIFSAGVVLYELLGGRRAFEAESFAATLYKILQEMPEPLQQIDPSLPPELVAVVDRALAKAREDRYQHMSEMLQDLVVFRQHSGAVEALAFGRPPSGGQTRAPGDARPSSEWPADAPTMPHTPSPWPAPAPGSGGSREAVAPPPSPTPALAEAAGAGPGTGRGRSRMRWWMGAAAAMAVVALTALGFWSVRSPRSGGAPATATAAQGEAAVHAQVATALREATRALEAGAFDEARRHAEAALEVAPDHAAARRLQERAAEGLETVDRRLGDARAHVDAGRYEEASRAAGDVLDLVPEHAGARQVMEEAAARSRGRGADEARTRMTRAKTAARSAGAQSLASAAFDAALGAERTAQRLYDAGRLAEATARFYEASGLFRSAELSAHTEAAARAERAAAARAEERRREDAAKTAALPRPADPPQAPPRVTRAAEPLPAGPAPVAPPVPKTASPPPPAAPPPAEAAISDLLARYEAALESRSLASLKQLWPSLGGSQETAIRNEFGHASRIDVEIRAPRIEVTGDTATATFLRRYELVTTDGQRLNSQSMTTMSLRKSAGTWEIAQVRFDPVR